MTIPAKKRKNALYRFYNYDVSRYGSPFAMCSTHAKIQKIPDGCHLQKIGELTEWPCEKCDDGE